MQHGLPGETLERLRAIFRQCPQIQRVLLYGSRARGDYRAGSDIDLAIDGPALSLTDRLALENSIDDLLLPWSVDLLVLQQLNSAELGRRIEREGRILYQRKNQVTEP